MPRAPDPLQPARHRLRALHLDDQVDGAHVDPELERRGRDETGDLAPLQQLLDLDPLLPRERAVMRAREAALGELVEPEREPLGEPAVVDEDDRRAMRQDELEQRRVDRRPDRAARHLDAGRHLDAVGEHGHGQRRGALELPHVVDGDDDLEVQLLPGAGVDERDLAPGAGDEAPDLRQRPLRRRQPDPLDRLVYQRLQAFQRDRKVSSPFRACNRMHLVHDHGLDAAEHLPALGGEEQIERLRCGDQDVGRLAEHLLALALRRIAGPDADASARSRAPPAGRAGCARCRS